MAPPGGAIFFCVRPRGRGKLARCGAAVYHGLNNKDAKGETLMIHSLRAAVLACAIAIVATPAPAQDYPSRTVKLIVPFGAGGPADVYARVLAQHLSEQLKQSFVVEDRPGAGSIIGTDAVAKAAP